MEHANLTPQEKSTKEKVKKWDYIKLKSITNYQGNANQNHLTPVRKAILKKTRETALARMYRKETCVHYWWECNWCSHYRNRMEIPQKTKAIIRPSNPKEM